MRRMLCQVPTNNLNRVFNSGPGIIKDQVPAAAAVRSYLSGRRRYWPADAEVRRSIRTRPFYWTGRGPQRTFVLRRLEESYGAPEPVDFSAARLTIEHVLPQTPTDEWLKLLAEEVTEESGPEELHDLLVHTLGNLTLTAENAKLSNNPFQRKQDILHASALQMNREIADAPAWGKTQILQRAEQMADRVIRIWPGPTADDGEEPDGRDWSLLRKACAALPTGTWTTYGDLAELIGSHPVPVGVHLAHHPVPNAWRVLMVGRGHLPELPLGGQRTGPMTRRNCSNPRESSSPAAAQTRPSGSPAPSSPGSWAWTPATSQPPRTPGTRCPTPAPPLDASSWTSWPRPTPTA